jgi:hypothetical protein
MVSEQFTVFSNTNSQSKQVRILQLQIEELGFLKFLDKKITN